MKRVFAILISLTLLVSLCACRVEDPNLTPQDDKLLNPGVEPDLPYEEQPQVDEPENENGVLPEEPVVEAVPFLETVANEEFTLTLSADKSVYFTGEEIYCEGVLSPNAPITVYGSADLGVYSIEGSAYFSDGQGGGVMTSELGIYTFDSEDKFYPLEKSGGFSASDPNADFYYAFFDDKGYSLPAGAYTITLSIHYSTDENDIIGTSKTLRISYPIEVIDNGTLPEYMTDIPVYEDPVTLKVYATDVEVTLTRDAANTLREIIAKYPKEEPSDCMFEAAFFVDGVSYGYSIGCGCLHNAYDDTYFHISDEDKALLDKMVSAYIQSEYEYDVTVDVEEPVDDPLGDDDI